MKRQILSTAIIAIFTIALAGQNARADILADGGALITHVGGMTGTVAGADRSAISPGGTLLGTGAQNGTPNRVADDFTLSAPMNNINSMTFFLYQTGATAQSMTGVFVEIWDAAPNAGGSVIWGDATTNVMTSTDWMDGPSGLGVYRTASGDTAGSTRRIQTLVASGLNIDLSAGTYWLAWGATGNVASGPWQPTVSDPDNFVEGNAIQFTNSTGSWNPALDAGSSLNVAFPFIIEGTAIPEPGAMSLLAIGVVLGLTRRRK